MSNSTNVTSSSSYKSGTGNKTQNVSQLFKPKLVNSSLKTSSKNNLAQVTTKLENTTNTTTNSSNLVNIANLVKFYKLD